MTNVTGINLCPAPFIDASLFGTGGYVDGRLCQAIGGSIDCCLPCPMTDWVYPDSFSTIGTVANWIATVSVICCVFLLLSWAVLPVDKTNRHYLSICFTLGILIMNMGFVIPLAAEPDQCFDTITPNDMHTLSVCGASGAMLMFGGWCGVMWAFLRSLSLHLQICWQVLVGRNFMVFAQAAGWGIPIIGLVLALVFSGVSFRFGATCHINHKNSLADFWIPLLIFASITVVTTFATFGYCIKVYLASLNDNAASTEGSSLPAYSNSVVTMSPRQAYRRVKRVIALQWRGIAIVLIIIADVIFFSVVFVFQDNIVQSIATDPHVAQNWIVCLIGAQGDKTKCLNQAGSLVVSEATVSAVLVLLALNGIWILFLLGRWTMVTGWIDLVKSPFNSGKKEFVSVDARYDGKNDILKSSATPSAPDYFGETARYNAPARSYSNPRPPQGSVPEWNAQQTYAPPQSREPMNPLAMNRI